MAMLTVTSLCFVSCGSDDDSSNGESSVTYTAATVSGTCSSSAANAAYAYFKEQLNGIASVGVTIDINAVSMDMKYVQITTTAANASNVEAKLKAIESDQLGLTKAMYKNDNFNTKNYSFSITRTDNTATKFTYNFVSPYIGTWVASANGTTMTLEIFDKVAVGITTNATLTVTDATGTTQTYKCSMSSDGKFFCTDYTTSAPQFSDDLQSFTVSVSDPSTLQVLYNSLTFTKK